MDQRAGGVDISDRDRVLTEPSAQFAPLLALAELPLGSMRACSLRGRELVICHTRAGVFALDNICTHAEAHLCEGRLRTTRIVCPLHGAAFDLRDGQVLAGPAVQPLATHPLRVADGVIEVALSSVS